MTPQVEENVTSPGAYTAPQVRPMENYAPKQIQDFAKGMNDFAQGLMHYQNNVDDAAVKSADADALDALTQISRDYQSQVGETAVNAEGYALKNSEDAIKKSSEKLQNPVQRQMFSELAKRRLITQFDQIKGHSLAQAQVWHEGSSQLRKDKAAGSMVLNAPYFDAKDQDGKPTGPYNEARNTVIAESLSYAQLKGYDKEMAQQLVAKNLAEADAMVIQRFVSDDNNARAKSFLDSHEEEIMKGRPDMIDQVKNLVESHSKTTDEVKIYRQLSQLPGGYSAQLKALNDAVDNGKSIAGIKNVSEFYKSVKQSLEHDKSVRDENQNKNIASILGQAQDDAYKNPGMTVLDWKKSNPIAYQALSNTGHNDSLGAIFNNPGVTDQNVKFNIYAHYGDNSDMDVLKMSDVQLYKLSSKLDMKDRDWMMGQVMQGRKKINDPGNIPKQFASLLNNKLTQVGISVRDNSTTNEKENYNTVVEYAQRYILEQQQVNGKPFNNEELSSKLNELFTKNVKFRNTIFGIETSSTSTVPMLKTQVSSDMREKIKQALIIEGNPNPTERDIQFRYWDTYGR